jgi:hypothetical protein
MKQSYPALTVFLALASCNQPAPQAQTAEAIGAATSAPASPAAQASAPAELAPPPSASPAATPPTASRDPQAVLEAWRHALETHDYAGARAVWGDFGKASKQSPATFAAAWDKYRIIDMTIGKGEQEGAAGSSYYEAPVTVTGLRRDGKPYNLSGTVTLRRVNDIDGATPEQLRWHIESSTLKP